MKAQLTDKFSFGKIVVDPKSNAIYLNGVEKRLEPKLITLLCLLAAQGRDVISRQDITQVIWPDVVVGEESITRAIFALRNALGDDAKQPQYIETIPKKGYRFLATAEIIIDETLAPVSEEPNPIITEVSVNNSRSIYMYAGFFGVCLLIALFVFWSRGEKPSVEIESILPLNKMEGVERSISLSADGTRLLFVHEDGQKQKNDLYSRDLQASKDTLWVRDEFLKTSPIWIDANTIAYIRRSGGDFQVIRNYQGQPPQVLYTSSKPILQLSMVNGDSENLFFLEFENNDLIELKSLNLRNGKQQNWRDLIPELPKKISQLQYAIKPDSLLFVKDANEKPAVISLDLHTKKITLINDQFGEINKIAAVNDHSVLVVGSFKGAEGIWLIDEPKAPQLVLRSSGAEKIVDIQIDLKKHVIFYANSQENTDVKMVASNGEEQYLPELNSSGEDFKGLFASNNKFIYFVSNRTGYYDIWRYDTELKSVKQISTLNAMLIIWFSFSHDGKKLAVSYRTSDIHLGILNIETGQLVSDVKTPNLRFPLGWSYDDKMLYASEHEAQINLFNYDIEKLQPKLFAEKSGLYVKAIDDTRLVYIDYTRHALVERNLMTEQEKVLHDTIPTLFGLSPGKIKVSKNNDGLFTTCTIDWQDKVCVYPLSATNSTPRVVSNVPGWQIFDISEDGETILALDVKPPSGDIMKMQLRHW